ncbi:MAG: hypothetical protein SCK70_10790, partial [bacterium]|nr:hypothetical protein [bacterium]
MKIRQAISNIRSIRFADNAPRVFDTVADEFKNVNEKISIKRGITDQADNALLMGLADTPALKSAEIDSISQQHTEFVYLQLNQNGSGKLICSHQRFLYAFVTLVLEQYFEDAENSYSEGKVVTPAFIWQRPVYDYFLTQPGRVQRGLNRCSYVRELARLGFTHVEVNGLAYPMSLETGPKGETYPMFYTYCPALDQFVYSKLNKGLYPFYYLSANLAYLKENAALAVKYGLSPGMLCFEPRSVPEEFFTRYPMLRGARVDHPFRSFKPRYNMTITHPLVREHYAEMMQKLMQAVPELGFISIWTNDSGAGFEHTKSLYVGRNGGAYLIREWKDDAEISRLAGENALRFFHTLRDAATRVNPDFRVITRMESFYGEHETVWNGLGNQLDIETNSLVVEGWGMPYVHPKYPDDNNINGGTIYQLQFDEKEKTAISELEAKEALAHFMITVGPHIMFDPLIGVPYPRLTHKRIQMLHSNGVNNLAHHGGTQVPELAPYNVNHEIIRHFQYDSILDIEDTINRLALKWAGEKYASVLAQAWQLAEDAIISFPLVVPLYACFGFTWYRLWSRPLVPNIEAIPKAERAYYEDFMCTTPHNPENVDLSRDVLFQLAT